MENKCYARGCEYNNVDCTCMYGKDMECRVHCDKCKHKCKKKEGDLACNKFIIENERGKYEQV